MLPRVVRAWALEPDLGAPPFLAGLVTQLGLSLLTGKMAGGGGACSIESLQNKGVKLGGLSTVPGAERSLKI